MSDSLSVQPEFRGTAELRKATSSCCAAKLDLGPDGPAGPRQWACCECGQPCERVLGEPEVITFHG